MAHPLMIDFINRIKNRFPEYFQNVSVLDFGSLDINGNNRMFFENILNYVGVDLSEGNNVDIVSMAHEYKSNQKFDVVMSTEMFEHDIFWRQSFLNAFSLLENNGLLIFTCAGYGRREHGTYRSEDWLSPTSKLDIWGNYYENRATSDFIHILDFEKEFLTYSFEYDGSGDSQDLYFFGIKRPKNFHISRDDSKIYVICKDAKKDIYKVDIIKNNSILFSETREISNDFISWYQTDINSGHIIVNIYKDNELIDKKMFYSKKINI